MKLSGLRTYGRAFAELLKIIDDDVRTRGKTAGDDPAIAVLRAEGHGIYMNRVIRGDGVYLLLTLEFSNCNLRNKNCPVKDLSLGFHPSKLTGTKYVARIRKRGGYANRTGLRVELPIDKCNIAPMRIDFTI